MKITRLILFGAVLFGMASCLSGEDPNKQLKEEMRQIDEHLTSVGLADDALYDNVNGFRLVINEYGENPPPHDGQTVKLYYEGRIFPTGTFFDAKDIETKLEDLTPAGLEYAASSIMAGTYVTVYVPSKYGYGEAGSAALGVPANAILIYDVYLEEVKRTAVEQSRFLQDSATIVNYLDDNQISSTYHPGGIWYTITESGSGKYPNVYSLITCQYKVSSLSNPGVAIEEGTLTQTSIFNLIDGFKVAMPLFNEGTKATFYLPSGLGYGTTGTQTIPANTNLIYEITLNTVH